MRYVPTQFIRQSSFVFTAMKSSMNIKLYVVIFCVLINLVKNDETSESTENQNEADIEQKSHYTSESFEEQNAEDNEKLNGKDSEDKKDDFISDTNTQEETLQTAPPKSMEYPENNEESDDENDVGKLEYDKQSQSSEEKIERNKESHDQKKPFNSPSFSFQTWDEEMEKALEAGEASDLFGTNQHYQIPVNYLDFGRRFVLTYPYSEKNLLDDAAEAELDTTVKQHLKSKKTTTKGLKPVKASPEFVLKIAKESAVLEASKPKNPTNEVIQKDILRTGEYWDDVWKEDVDVKKMLRNSKNDRSTLESITVTVRPGSKLHTLISMLKSRSPRLLYVINKNRY